MKNNKGFVLLETAVVLIIVVMAMLGLYSTYSFVFKSLKQSEKYDNINDVYKLNIFYDMRKESVLDSLTSNFIKITSSDCTTYFDDSHCSNLMSDLGFSYFIYINKDMDLVLLDPSGLSNTDINYLKSLEFGTRYLVGAYGSDSDMHYVSLKVGDTL